MLRRASLEVLSAFLWMAQTASRPTMRNLMGMGPDDQRLTRLAEGGYLVREEDASGAWVYRLAEKGRLAALGGRDPETMWARAWDGNWRFFLFDLPGGESIRRQQLWRWLKENHFGCLQRSVWITPDRGYEESLSQLTVSPSELVYIEGSSPSGRASDPRKMAESAWDFAEINALYGKYLKVLESHPQHPSNKGTRTGFSAWKRREMALWAETMAADPLLPRDLNPRGYLGFKSWKKRDAILRQLSR